VYTLYPLFLFLFVLFLFTLFLFLFVLFLFIPPRIDICRILFFLYRSHNHFLIFITRFM